MPGASEKLKVYNGRLRLLHTVLLKNSEHTELLSQQNFTGKSKKTTRKPQSQHTGAERGGCCTAVLQGGMGHCRGVVELGQTRDALPI